MRHVIQDTGTVRLYVLGAFRLEREGEAIPLKTRKVAALLAFLALHPQEHAREKVAALLWGDSTDEAARRSLRVALSGLRAALGTDAILSDTFTVQLNPQFELWVDANALDDAPELYQGELLTDFYDDWILEARAQVRERFIARTLTHAQNARAAGEYERARDAAERVLRADRANETAHQHLMFCAVVLGQRNAALEQYALCERALREELGVEPSAETRALADWIRQAPGTRTLAGQVTNLPLPLSSFVGRRSQVAEIKKTLGTTRLLTLHGAGGSGKTRLAIQTGIEMVGTRTDGVWWVELAALSDPALVVEATARTLGVRETSGESLCETLRAFLRDKDLLLILDNCEHLVTACAELATEILAHCARVTILTTSRETLNVTGEVSWYVPTLALPVTDKLSLAALLMEYEAVQLFVERARAANPRFELTEENALAVAHICRRLDGIPLALELAAARVRVLSVEQIAARLDDRFQLLTGGSRTALPRQQTLRALIDWSYALLNESERELFGYLSVFRGGWTLAACEGMLERLPEGGKPADVSEMALDFLTRLVDKSLVTAEARGDEMRYAMSETVREYARLRLEEMGRAEEVRRAHLGSVTAHANVLEPQFLGADQKRALDEMERELDNVRAALDWAYSTGDGARGLDLAVALIDFWIRREHFAEGQQRFRQGLELTRAEGATAARAGAYNGLSVLAGLEGDFEAAAAQQENAVAMYRELGDTRGQAYGLHTLGVQSKRRGDILKARAYYIESLGLARELEERRLEAYNLNSLGHVEWQLGNAERATMLTKESLELMRAAADPHAVTIRLHNLAQFAVFAGELEDAERYVDEAIALCREMNYGVGLAGNLLIAGTMYRKQGGVSRALEAHREALTLGQELGTRDMVIECFEAVAACYALNGRAGNGAQLLGAAEHLRKRMRMRRPQDEQAYLEETLPRLKAALGEEQFALDYEGGMQLTVEEAVGLCF